jgi:protein TonB
MRAFTASLAITALSVAQAPPGPPPLRISAGVLAGNILTKVVPKFPEEAKRQQINGAVVMHVIVGTDGRVKEAHIISGPELLRASYLDAVKQWTYRPYLVNGEPVAVETQITIVLSF